MKRFQVLVIMCFTLCVVASGNVLSQETVKPSSLAKTSCGQEPVATNLDWLEEIRRNESSSSVDIASLTNEECYCSHQTRMICHNSCLNNGCEESEVGCFEYPGYCQCRCFFAIKGEN
jgi:hypothetical protein